MKMRRVSSSDNGRKTSDMCLNSLLHGSNPRSPAFALQAIYKLVEKNGVVDARWRLHTRIKEKIETTYRDRVSWNEMLCHWQVGTGTHVPFEEIAKAAIRWYINGWDLTRHTRDTEVQYPEDVELGSRVESARPMACDSTSCPKTKLGCLCVI
jgi:hypothetical protein